MHHPALAHKYRIVRFTRGIGIEVGEGITPDTEPLYAHFGKVRDLPGAPERHFPTFVHRADGSYGYAAGHLDFVLVCGDEPTEPYVCLLKEGGHMVHVRGADLEVSQRQGDDLVPAPMVFPARSACVVRYGGFGDMIQAANIFPALKREGFQVYVMTTPKGMSVIEHDPHVDGFLLQDTDQVPNMELPAFWEEQAKLFDRFVNLSESVEGTLLAYEGRANHRWPIALRRKMLGDVNYLEFTSELAEVPYASESHFYPTDEERAAAERFLTRVRVRAANAPSAGPVNAPATFNIMFALSGSAIHKMYPHMDDVIANVLKAIPEATFTLVGDEASRLLETGWENHGRVWCTSGKIGIRETLALAQKMDCVLGPETGVLNAVAFEPMKKVILLSHSSQANLTRHWSNTEAIEPPTACYPCHQLHVGRGACPEHEPTGASMCAWEIEPFRVFAAVARGYEDWKRLRELRAAA